jgi:hypothetical protein
VADAARLLPDVQVERGGVVAGERARDVKSPARRSRAGLTRFVVNLGNAMAVLYLLYFRRDRVHYSRLPLKSRSDLRFRDT